jgi:N utilization substance protein B
MTARSIARELAVIVFPQLPKDRQKLEKGEISSLVVKAVAMLCDYAKQNLLDANALLLKASESLAEIESEHPLNSENIDELVAVPVTTGQLRQQLDLIERTLYFVSEALDIPETLVQVGQTTVNTTCKKCKTTAEHHIEHSNPSEVKEFLYRLVETYFDNREQIDEFIKQARAKWKIERMVSIDRDIVRLACAEAFYMPDIPVNVCISEAVALSHRFADERAAKFINGILGDLAEVASSFRRSGVLTNLEATQPMPEIQPK